MRNILVDMPLPDIAPLMSRSSRYRALDKNFVVSTLKPNLFRQTARSTGFETGFHRTSEATPRRIEQLEIKPDR